MADIPWRRLPRSTSPTGGPAFPFPSLPSPTTTGYGSVASLIRSNESHVVSRKQVPHLRIHRDEEPITDNRGRNVEHAGVEQLLTAFSAATGWEVRAIDPSLDSLRLAKTFGWPAAELGKRVKLVHSAPVDGLLDESDFFDYATTPEQSAWTLLESLSDMVSRLKQCEEAVARQEAELATGLSVTLPANSDEASLYETIEDVLQRATELTGSDAAAVYLLDDATSTLKMRGCFGLPKSALAKPPRMLRGALADLEALLGNAVLLENLAIAPDWNSPEPFAAGLCVPIGSATMPHGTLWLWSDHVRDFSTGDIEAAKDACDRILNEVERRVLSSEVVRVRSAVKQLDAAGFVQSSLLPDAQTLHADYDIGGLTCHSDVLGGSFHSWTVNAQEQIVAVVGTALNGGAAGALVAARLKTVFDMINTGRGEPADMLRRANDLIWSLEDPEWRCSLGWLAITPGTGNTTLACAGAVQAFLIGQRGYRPLNVRGPVLGLQPDSIYRLENLQLEPGDTLALAPTSLLAGAAHGGLSQEQFLSLLMARQEEPLADLAAEISQQLPLNDARRVQTDHSLILVRRRF
jgi:phosphoserine phosphatase RsbU/P